MGFLGVKLGLQKTLPLKGITCKKLLPKHDSFFISYIGIIYL